MRGAVIGAAIFILMFFAGMAQARLGYTYEENRAFYGKPYRVNQSTLQAVWINNKHKTTVTFNGAGVAVAVETLTPDKGEESQKIIDQFFRLNIRGGEDSVSSLVKNKFGGISAIAVSRDFKWVATYYSHNGLITLRAEYTK